MVMLDINSLFAIAAIVCGIASAHFLRQALQEKHDTLGTPEHKTVAGVIAAIMAGVLFLLFLIKFTQ